MKYFIVVGVVFTFVCKAELYVVSSTKDVEITTVSQKTQAVAVDGTESKNENRHDVVKELMKDENYIYLDDVMYALKHQNWTEEEKPCLNQTLRLLFNLQNSTLWAVWGWDSTSSEPQGILFGNRYQLGNFDECMSAPWYETQPDLRMQYCLAEIELERYEKRTTKKQKDLFNPYGSALDYMESRSKFKRPFNIVTWGACVPVSCSPSSVTRLMEIMLAHSYVGAAGLRAKISLTEECQKVDEPMPFNGLFFAFVGTMGCLTVFVLICTYLNRKMNNNTKENSIGKAIVNACCLRKNFKDLYKMQKDGLEVLYGVRFLSMCVVVMGHQYGMFSGGPVSNGYNVDKDAMTIPGMMLLHDDIVVDSFFFLSGFLAARGVVGFKRLPNIFLLFLKRYIRLVVAYAVIIFFVVSVYPYTGSGPLWKRAIAADKEQCLENWWISLLMLNNYINSDNMCLVVSWYIPCDFHFFVITILLYCLYKKLPTFGSVCVISVTIAAVIVPGVINYVHQLPAIQLFTYEFLTNPRNQKQFQVSYIKSHNRYASYLIGSFFGYYYTTRRFTGTLAKISRKWSILGACASILIMMSIMLSGPALVWAGYGLLIDAIYAALNRPVWAIGVAMLVACCSLGKVSYITSFLSWSPWVPLSRLAYGLYITHSVIISRNVHVTRSPQHTDYLILLNSTAGVVFWGCIASLAIWLIAEAPINNLLTLCLKRRTKEVKTENNLENEHRSSIAADNGGYLPDNLPREIWYSSKI